VGQLVLPSGRNKILRKGGKAKMDQDAKKVPPSEDYAAKIGCKIVESTQQILAGNPGVQVVEFVIGLMARFKNEKDEVVMSPNIIRVATILNPGTDKEDFCIIPLDFRPQQVPLPTGASAPVSPSATPAPTN
jgi:hypothetical protein